MKRMLRILLALAILGLSGATAVHWIRTRPRAKERPRPPISAVVEVVEVRPMTRAAVVRGMGEVVPAREVAVLPEVGGRVVERHPDLEPGGRILADAVLARIDSRDYEAALRQAEAALEKARFDLVFEEGRGVVAREEWSRLGGEVPTSDAGRDLALREPHLRMAKAALVAAESGVAKAAWNLERTELRAPFDAVVIEKNVDAGQVVTLQSRIARLVDTERFWVLISVQASELTWFGPPAADGSGGASATVYRNLGNGLRPARAGRVARILGDLDGAGRMARVLVEVERPLDAAGGPPLLLGSFVEAEIAGRPMADVVELPRVALREGDCVWIMTPQDTLEIRPVSITRQTPDTFVVGRGLAAGERVVTGRIALPIPGMPLRVSGAPAAAADPDQPPPRAGGERGGEGEGRRGAR